jgi:TP901 family phage tail tape measure protein
MAKSVIELNINQTVTGPEQISKLSSGLEDLQKSLQKSQSGMNSLKKSIGETIATCATFSTAMVNISSAVDQLAQGYNEYDKAMRAVNTMAGKDEGGFIKLKDQVGELAKTIPLAKDQLANGLYQVISNGVPENNWISYLNASAKSSVGGIADLGQVVNVTSTLIKNYSLGWQAAGEIQDKIQMTAIKGVTTFEQLAGALPKVAGNAATLGVSVDELMASFAALTSVSGGTDEVATQLVAVFSALIKPTSEASKLADQMGIQFNAAAIKAAGGMQQFISQLVESVKQYSAQTGKLEEEVYSTLFGSSRAMRGLIPLIGSQAEKYKQSIEDMKNANGTMAESYDQMNSTAEAATQRIKNQISAITGLIGCCASTIQPYLQYIAVVGQSIAGLKALYAACTMAIANINKMTVAMLGQTTTTKLANIHLKVMIGLEGLLTRVTNSTAVSVRALDISAKALYATLTMGVALAISALVEAFIRWSSSADDAAKSIGTLTGINERFKTKVADTTAEIEDKISNLKYLINANIDASSTIDNLNDSYGRIFGTYRKASEWYKVLTENVKNYAKQLGYEAAAREYSTQKGEKAQELAEKQAAARKLIANGKVELKHYGKDGAYTKVLGKEKDAYNQLQKEIKTLTSEVSVLDKRYNGMMKSAEVMKDKIRTSINGNENNQNNTPWQQQSIEQLKKTIESQQALVERLGDGTSAEAKREANLLAKQKARLAILNKIYGLGTSGKSKSKKLNGDKLIADADSLEALRNNLKYYDNQINKTSKDDIEHTKALQAKRDEIDAHIKELELLHEKMGLPKEMKNLSDYDAWLSFLNSAAVTATAEEYVKLKQSIKDVQRQRDEFEAAAEPVLNVEDIKTSEDLEKAISRVSDKLSKATLADRAALIKEKNVLLDLQRTWEDYEESLTAPKDISQLNTVRELSNAVSYYQALQEKQSAEEITNTQKVINKLEAKKNALQRGITLLDKQREIDDMNKLSGKELKIKIRDIGFDELLSKIKELQKALNDTENPVSDDDRVRIEKLIKTYKGWAKQAYNTGDALKDAYSGIKTIGNGIISLNETLKGDGTAWEKIISLVDTFISISEGIGNLVGIVDKLSKLTGIFTAKKVAEGVAESTAAAAAGENTAAAATNAAAMVATTVANKTATASFVELAAAQYMAAHAYIPFAGFGIASGFAASAAAVVEAIGAMPFAKGGIISGPTLGIMGEYPGASRNPEVVAPLDKLRTLLQPAGGLDAKNFVFKLRGRDLVAVYQGEANIKERM